MSQEKPITVAVLQMTCRLGDKRANLERTASLLAEMNTAADIAALPELFSTGYNLEALDEALYDLAEPVPGPTTEALGRLARDFDVALLAGIVERDAQVDDVLYDSAILFTRGGELVARYRKTHLYPLENRFFRAGDKLPVVNLDGLRVGVAICFEHAFPHIFTTLALRGAQIVFNPSAVPRGYGYLQDVRIPARAQDNQIFVVAANHVGPEGKVTYCGRSQIANPRGETLALASGEVEEVITAQLDLSLIRNQRRQEPIFRGFRPELYEP
jgi:predicted amidohydrolase